MQPCLEGRGLRRCAEGMTRGIGQNVADAYGPYSQTRKQRWVLS
jgi:hypothetical protein